MRMHLEVWEDEKGDVWLRRMNKATMLDEQEATDLLRIVDAAMRLGGLDVVNAPEAAPK